MGIRPAKCYRRVKKANTRFSLKNPKKSYVKGVPQSKIRRFESGNKKKAFPLIAYLVSDSDVQIRHNALEAARIAAHKVLQEMGDESYFLKVLVYPHHIMRENALATGAGADRFQTGMRKAFGKPLGLAAHVKSGQRLIRISLPKSKQSMARLALRRAGAKLPTKYRIRYEEA